MAKPPSPVRLARPAIAWSRVEPHLRAVVRSGWLTNGPFTQKFERALARRVHTGQAVATSTGTSAIHLALLAHDVGPGDEVVVADYTFPATVNAILHAGASPVLVDVDPRTFNLDPKQASNAVTSRTKAIMPVDQFGLAADLEPLQRLASRHGVALIEDAACALGAVYRGKPCGAWGDCGCFSFHPRKVATTGEGGAVVTSDSAIADRVRLWRNHGMKDGGGRRTFAGAAFNYRLPELSAVLGIEQLGRLGQSIRARRALAARYTSRLRRLGGVQTPYEPDGSRHTFQSYAVVLPDANRVQPMVERLHAAGIEASGGAEAVHTLDYVRKRVKVAPAGLPVSRRLHESTVILPLHPKMTRAEIDRVVDAFGEALP